MDDTKKTALKRVFSLVSVVIVSGFYRFSPYLLSGNLFVWIAYIFIIILCGTLTYYGQFL